MTREENIVDFWDGVTANIEWEGLELNDGHQLRVIVPCIDGKAHTFDFWPKRRKATHVGSNRFQTISTNTTLEKWIKDYIKRSLRTGPVKEFKK